MNDLIPMTTPVYSRNREFLMGWFTQVGKFYYPVIYRKDVIAEDPILLTPSWTVNAAVDRIREGFTKIHNLPLDI